jgi:hypothetical protein
MFALLSSFAFAGAAGVAAYAVTATFNDNRSRIVDAIRGRPVPVTPAWRAAA